MKKGLILYILFVFFLTACDPGSGSGDGDGGSNELPNDFTTMISAKFGSNITYPTGSTDSGTTTLTTPFSVAETEMTNAQIVEVLNWAYNAGKFSNTITDHNGLDATACKYGGQLLLDLDDSNIRISFDDSTKTFSSNSGYANHPIVCITWYGAVMVCNWLSEKRDGDLDNIVYSGITESWTDSDTVENISKNGYRLPNSYEWEFVARYRGNDSTNSVSGYTNPYYTKGDSASGATANTEDTTACNAVAVHSDYTPQPSEAQAVKSLGESSKNAYGVYDISGNVKEWCFTYVSFSPPYTRSDRGGSWDLPSSSLDVGLQATDDPSSDFKGIGLRIYRSE